MALALASALRLSSDRSYRSGNRLPRAESEFPVSNAFSVSRLDAFASIRLRVERPAHATYNNQNVTIFRSLCAYMCVAAFGSPGLGSQKRSVAITVDDLPYASGGAVAHAVEEASQAESVNRRLLAAFRARHVPVTGFVIQKRVEALGAAGPKILGRWTSEGLDLGNHTYSHPDTNALTIEQIREEIVRGELTVGPLMKEAGKKLEFFRFPMNQTGDTKAKHDVIAEFLLQRGYELATCTIDTSDYVFNQAYARMAANHDAMSIRRLRRDYLAYTDTEIDYYAALNRRVLGYEPPEVMLLHDNRLNADVIDQLLRLFRQKGYEFVTLASAQSDPAYRQPETYITKFGPMWGYRWARERNVKVDGRLESDPPKWISEYPKPSEPSAGHEKHSRVWLCGDELLTCGCQEWACVLSVI
jgi:peptidoglycan/xylan/chitin deacetylase (PgdA/CDA1 family)